MPPKIDRCLAGIFRGVVLGAAVLGAGAVLFFFNPSTHGFYPVCLFHELTGLNCPGCGGTRAAYQLLHGHLLQRAAGQRAVRSVARGAGGARRVVRRAKNPQPARRAVFAAKVLWALLVVAVVFTVLRNLPAFSFLSP